MHLFRRTDSRGSVRTHSIEWLTILIRWSRSVSWVTRSDPDMQKDPSFPVLSRTLSSPSWEVPYYRRRETYPRILLKGIRERNGCNSSNSPTLSSTTTLRQAHFQIGWDWNITWLWLATSKRNVLAPNWANYRTAFSLLTYRQNNSSCRLVRDQLHEQNLAACYNCDLASCNYVSV